LIGRITGGRLPAPVKLQIIAAIAAAHREGLAIDRACEVVMLDPRRYRRWVRGRDPEALGEPDVRDAPPVARRRPHALLPAERREIRAAATEPELAALHHRKLTHELSRRDRVFCSESSVLRELRTAGLVPVYQRRSRPVRPGPATDESEPNRTWRYDLTTLPTSEGPYHLVPVIDGCSRKIVGRHFSPEATSDAVQTAWGKALANEGLLAAEGPDLPVAASDRGTQMTSRSTRQFFFDLGVVQSFSRPRTPTDNATCESWMATLKCERLYDADTAGMTPTEVLSLVDRFIDFYNDQRLHQSLGFVTPAERHDGRHTAILEARRAGMERARAARAVANGHAPDPGSTPNGAEGASQSPVFRRSRRKGVIGPCS
jgi:putative transposase